jgi:hypothetical protein
MFKTSFIIATNWDMPNKNVKCVQEDVATANSALKVICIMIIYSSWANGNMTYDTEAQQWR